MPFGFLHDAGKGLIHQGPVGVQASELWHDPGFEPHPAVLEPGDPRDCAGLQRGDESAGQ